MTDRTLDQYAELLRNDFAGFAHRAFIELYPGRDFEANWHVDVLSEKLEAVRRGKIRRLIINVPPRSLKSFLGSIAFPAFVLGHNPSAEILCTSYGQDFANDLALPCRNIMQSSFYQSLFTTRLSEDRQAVEEFKTTAGGARRAVSLSGAVMGRGADYIVIDDPIKADEALSESRRTAVNLLFSSSIATRLNRDTGVIVLIMQRLHISDLTAFVQKSEEWEVVALPALAERDEIYQARTPYGLRDIHRSQGQPLQPNRQSRESLLQIRASQGTRTFDAQYQQKPHGGENAIVQRGWLTRYDDNSRPGTFGAVLQSWDTATKPGDSNSYNVCTTWGVQENRFYLLDVFRERMGFRELKLKAMALAREYKPTSILIEEQASGSPLLEELRSSGFPVEAVSPGSASKEQRLYGRSNRFENGQVLLPKEAPWLDIYIEELTTFPDSDFSDQVDSTSQALSWDTSNTSFSNAIRAMEMLNGGSPFGERQKTIKLRVLEGGGVITFEDGSGRPSIQVPPAGGIIEIDELTGARLVQTQWKKFQIISE